MGEARQQAPLASVQSKGAGGSVLVAFDEKKLSNYSVAPGSLDACILFLEEFCELVVLCGTQ